MIQTFSPKNVLKKFGTWGENLATEDLNQLHGMETYFTLDSKTLTKDNQEETLVQLMLLVGKRNGDIKSRGCADGRKNLIRESYNKEDAT